MKTQTFVCTCTSKIYSLIPISYCSLDPTAWVILPRNASAYSFPAKSASSRVMFRNVTSPRRSVRGCDVIATLLEGSMNIQSSTPDKKICSKNFLGTHSFFHYQYYLQVTPTLMENYRTRKLIVSPTYMYMYMYNIRAENFVK